MPLSSRQLIDFLEEVEEQLQQSITLVAAGGTAMTLYRLKPSTIDVDFTGPGKDIDLFRRAVRLVQAGFKVDTWPNGQVFSQFLPPDYLRKSKPIKTHLQSIKLKALQPLDIVVTKLGRLDERDFDDIKACIEEFKLSKGMIIRRARQVHYVGNERVFEQNLRSVTSSRG